MDSIGYLVVGVAIGAIVVAVYLLKPQPLRSGIDTEAVSWEVINDRTGMATGIVIHDKTLAETVFPGVRGRIKWR